MSAAENMWNILKPTRVPVRKVASIKPSTWHSAGRATILVCPERAGLRQDAVATVNRLSLLSQAKAKTAGKTVPRLQRLDPLQM